MELAGCILLLQQLFLHLFFTYTNLPYLLLNQFFSCFLQLVFSILSSVGPVYVFHLLYVPLHSSKHFSQVVLKHDHTTAPICPCQLICCFLQSQNVHQLLCISLVHNFTAHINLTIDFSAFLKIATSFFLKHHVSLPYQIADLT